MKLKFWGVRGSIPVPGPTSLHFGGNTSCYSLNGAGGESIIMDAGSGIRQLGFDFMIRKAPRDNIHLLISHTHWDHIQGFPFFVPNYVPGSKIHVHGPVNVPGKRTLQEVFELQMTYDFFPVTNDQLAAEIKFESHQEMDFDIGNIHVTTRLMNHPILNLAYRLTENGRTMVYTGDHEPYHNVFASNKPAGEEEDDLLFGGIEPTVQDANQRIIEFFKDAKVVVMDCQYTPEEYHTSRRNWGHGHWDYCLDCMQKAGVERLYLTHHEPTRSDQALEQNLVKIREKAASMGINPECVDLAREGVEVEI